MPFTVVRESDVLVEAEIKRSRFLTAMRRVTDEASAVAFIAERRALYPDARHHCSAFVLGADPVSRVERGNDDGEPGGTAGTPMLGVLRGRDLVDVCVVVTRYFGGVKLGAGGLARAYSGAVSQVADAAPQIELVRRAIHSVAVDHADAGRVQGELRNRGAEVLGVEYGAQAVITLTFGDPDELASIAASVTSGRAEVRRIGDTWAEAD